MANYTSVTASNICDAAGNKLASGTVSFQATDAANQPLNFQVGGGGQVVTTPATAAIVAGAIAGGFQVADSANTSPAGILYRITITDTTLNRVVVTYSLVTVTGTTFSLDNFSQTGAAVLPPVGGSVNGPLTVNGNLNVTGSLGTIDVTRLGGIRFAADFASGSLTGGIQEAINDLPASGGTVYLPLGTTVCAAGITINKPCRLIGHGSGGLNDQTTFSTFIAATLLVNNTTSTDLITVSLPAANVVDGVSLEAFAIQGNKTVSSVTAGDNIVFSGGGVSTSILGCSLDNILSFNAKGSNLSIKNNSYMIRVFRSRFYRAGGDIVSISQSTGQPSQIAFFGCTLGLTSTGDALKISGNTGDVNAYSCTFHDCVNGVEIAAGASNASFHAFTCNFEKNTNAGFLGADGFGHLLQSCSFPADGVQLYGVNFNPQSGAGFTLNQITLIGNTFASNLTKDVLLGANLHVGVVFPQATNQAAYSYTDSSGNAVVLDPTLGTLNITGVLAANLLSGRTADLIIKARSGGTNVVVLQSTPGGLNVVTVDQSGNIATLGTSLKVGATGTGLVNAGSLGNGGANSVAVPDPLNAGKTLSLTVASGTAVLGTSAIAAVTSAAVVTVAASGVATTDAIEWSFNAAPGTGYTTGLHVLAYVTSGNVNFVVVNPTAGSLTPAAATLNWRVVR